MYVEFKSFCSYTLYFLIVLLASSRSKRVEGLRFFNTVSHVLKVQTAVIQNDDELKSEIKNFWDYETLGIKSGVDNLTQNADLLDNKILSMENVMKPFCPLKKNIP